MRDSWNNLIQCAIDNNDTMVFHEISEVLWTTEEAADEALFELEDFLKLLIDNGRGGGCGGDAENNVTEMDISSSDVCGNTNGDVGETEE